MKTPSPLIPQGTLPTHGRSHVPIIVSTILALHFVLLGALLIAGCKPTTSSNTAYSAPAPTNDFAALPPWVEPTNPTPFQAAGSLEPSARVEFQVPPAVPEDAAPPPAYDPPSVTPETSASRPVVVPPSKQVITSTQVIPTTRAVSSKSETTHVVVKGDLFYTLAKRYGVSPKAIASANPGVNPSQLQIGQKLIIPASEPPAPKATEPLVTNGGSLYVVRSGDNLTRIAKNNNTTVEKLRSENSLRTDRIKVGQKLRIPEQ